MGFFANVFNLFRKRETDRSRQQDNDEPPTLATSLVSDTMYPPLWIIARLLERSPATIARPVSSGSSVMVSTAARVVDGLWGYDDEDAEDFELQNDRKDVSDELEEDMNYPPNAITQDASTVPQVQEESDNFPMKKEEEEDEPPLPKPTAATAHPEDSQNSRADWAPIRAIPQPLFQQVLLEHLPATHNLTPTDISPSPPPMTEIQGGFNFIRMLDITAGPHASRYVIKIPCIGTPSRWQDADAYMLRNEVRTMLYMREKTKVPVPEVLGYSDTLSNTLGAPYTIMRASPGVPSHRIWFDGDGDDRYRPSDARAEMRRTFLRSLARAMSHLQTLEFDQAGMLDFDDSPTTPSIGPVYFWKTTDEMEGLSPQDFNTPDALVKLPVSSTSIEYHIAQLDRVWPQDDADTSPRGQRANGIRYVMEMMLYSAPLLASQKHESDSSGRETFVLRHDDLDFQNILCCPVTGEVTAIIDWDRCRAVPRCYGFAAVPCFLTYDWLPGFSPYTDCHMPWELQEYRRIYADAMVEATGAEGDGRFTFKSPIYEAYHAALYGGTRGGNTQELVCRLLREIPCTRALAEDEVLECLGEGWDQGEWKVEEEVVQLIAPEFSSIV